MTILDLAQAHPLLTFVYLCLLIMTFSPYVRERRVIDPDSAEWRDFMAAALMAQFIALPMPVDRNEPIPGSDDLEGEDE